MPRGSLSLAHADGPLCDARHSSFQPGKNSVRPTFNLLWMSHIRNSVRLTFHLLRMYHIRNPVWPTFHLLLMSHIRNFVRPTFYLTRMSHIWNSSLPTFQPGISHSEFFSADIPPGCLTSRIFLRRHSTRISHIRNSVRPTFHLLRIFRSRRLLPGERGGRFNFTGQTCPDPLVTLTRTA